MKCKKCGSITIELIGPGLCKECVETLLKYLDIHIIAQKEQIKDLQDENIELVREMRGVKSFLIGKFGSLRNLDPKFGKLIDEKFWELL